MHQAQYQSADRGDGARSAWAFSPAVFSMAPPDQVTVPAQDGIRSHDQPQPSQRLAWQRCEQGGQKCAICRFESGPGGSEQPLQHAYLVAQRQDLNAVRAGYSSVLVKVPYVLTPCCAAAGLQRRGEMDESGSVSGGMVSVEGPAVVWAVRTGGFFGAAAALAGGMWIRRGDLPGTAIASLPPEEKSVGWRKVSVDVGAASR